MTAVTQPEVTQHTGDLLTYSEWKDVGLKTLCK